MAITITTYELATNFESINLTLDAGTGNTITTLHMFINEGYLTPTPIDLSVMLAGTQVETLVITLDDLDLSSKSKIQGIVTFYAVASNSSKATQALVNLYYLQLVLANIIINKEMQQSYQEVATIYFLLKAIDIYINLDTTNQKIEQATNAYERVLAMCERNPVYLLDQDTETSAGSGNWIINGTYIIN
jgi:hypothetical protein